MAPKIFLTGVTGYIAGDAFYVLNEAHPDYEYAVLVRTQDKADAVKKAYPRTRIVLGGLDDSKVLEEEAAKADIVLHAADASDHESAAKAIAAGMVKGHSNDKPGFWLHTGGTGILTYFDTKDDKLGEDSKLQFDDWSGVDKLTHLPDEAFHRNVDKIVLETSSKHGDAVKTAIVCPPTIYGEGRGPVSVRGRQVYTLASVILNKQYAPIIGEGKARWDNIHVADLSDVFLRLVDQAVAGNLDNGLWGAKGYYLVENGNHVWGELSRTIAQKAGELGYIPKGVKEQAVDKEEAMKIGGFEALSWGLNSRGTAERAKHVLGWKASRPSLVDEIPNILKEEKARMQ